MLTLDEIMLENPKVGDTLLYITSPRFGTPNGHITTITKITPKRRDLTLSNGQTVKHMSGNIWRLEGTELLLPTPENMAKVTKFMLYNQLTSRFRNAQDRVNKAPDKYLLKGDLKIFEQAVILLEQYLSTIN